MVDKGTWLTPTIILARTRDQHMAEKGVPTPVDGYFVPHYRRAYEAGVRMGCGCDSGAPRVPWGPSLHWELREYVYGLGMSPLEAIKCATQNNATIFGIDHKVGTIKEGMLADILIVGGDPVEKIENSRMSAWSSKRARSSWTTCSRRGASAGGANRGALWPISIASRPKPWTLWSARCTHGLRECRKDTEYGRGTWYS